MIAEMGNWVNLAAWTIVCVLIAVAFVAHLIDDSTPGENGE